MNNSADIIPTASIDRRDEKNRLWDKVHRIRPFLFQSVRPDTRLDLGAFVTLPAGYNPTNPSIARLGDDLVIVVRGVNYVTNSSMQQRFSVGEIYHTINHFYLLDRQLRFKRHLPDLDDVFDDIEDMRLFNLNERVLGIGNRFADGGNIMVLIGFDPTGRLRFKRDIASPYGYRREKNWSPFIHNGDLFFVYSFSPLIIVKYDFETGRVKPVDQWTVEIASRDWSHRQPSPIDQPRINFLDSGSSSGLLTDRGWLFATHRRKLWRPSRRIYVSRLCHISSDFSTTTVGRYFIIDEPTIQAIHGMLITDDQIIVTYGEMDRTAHLASFNLHSFDSKLIPLASL